MQAEMRQSLRRLPSALRSSRAIRQSFSNVSSFSSSSSRRKALPHPLVHATSGSTSCFLCNHSRHHDMSKRRLSSRHGHGGLFAFKTPPPRRVSEEQLQVLKQMVNQKLKDPERMQEAYDLVRTMMREFIFPTMYGMDASLMTMTADALDDPGFVIQVYSALCDGNVEPSPTTLELTSKACAATGNWQLACEIVERMHHHAVDAFEINPLVYENAILACHRATKWMKAMRFLETMQERNLPASRLVYLKALETCIRAQESTATSKVLAMYFKAYPVLDDPDQAQRLLIRCLDVALQADDLEHVMLFRKVLEELEMPPPSKDQMVRMVDLCMRQNEWKPARNLLFLLTDEPEKLLAQDPASDRYLDLALEVYDEMKRLGLPISLASYNTLLRGCGRHAGYYDRVDSILHDMQHNTDEQVKPNAVSYAAAMCAYSSRSLGKVQQLYTEMIVAGLEPTNDVFHAYLHSCTKAKAHDHAVEFYETNQLDTIDQIQQDPRILSLMAVAYGQTGRLDQLLRLFAHMKMNGLDPTLHVYPEMLFAYCKLGQFDRALLMWSHFETLGFSTTQRFNKPTLWEGAVMACHRAIQHGRQQDEPTYEYMSRLVDIYEQLMEGNVRVTHNTMNMLLARLVVVSASNLWDFYMRQTHLHSVELHGDKNIQTVRLALCRARDDQEPDLLDHIAQVAEETLQLPPEAERFSILLGFYARQNDMQNVAKWCDKTRASGVPLNKFVYGAALCFLGQPMVQHASRTTNCNNNSSNDNSQLALALNAITELFQLPADPQASALQLAQQVVTQAIAKGFGDHTYLMHCFVGMCNSHEEASVFLELLQANDMKFEYVQAPDLAFDTVRLIASHPARTQLCRQLLGHVLRDDDVDNLVGALEAFRVFFNGESQLLVEILGELDTDKYPLKASTLEQLLLCCSPDKDHKSSSLDTLDAMCEQLRRWTEPPLTPLSCELLRQQLESPHNHEDQSPSDWDVHNNIQSLLQEGLSSASSSADSECAVSRQGRRRLARAQARGRVRARMIVNQEQQQLSLESLAQDA